MNKKIILVFLISISAVCASSQAQLRFDGYYRTLGDSLNPFSFYLRFYNDSTVISINTAGDPANLVKWFNKDHKDLAIGAYTLNQPNISFILKSKEGSVSYEGIVDSNRLMLNVKSLINTYKGKEEYYFLKMDGLK